MISTSEENKMIYRRMIEEGFNKGNMAVVDELVAADHVNHTDNVRGPDEYKRFINMFRTAFPDLHMTIDFLNRWGNCRMAKQKRRKLRIALERLPRSIRSLPSLEADQDLDSEAERLVIKCYSVLRNVVGPTAVSKILHLTNPRFFVMWDEAIREDARLRAVNTADGYLEFLNKMRSVGKCVVEDFRVSYSDEKKGPAIFLSKKLGLHPPLSLAKFIDEYNWITVTRQAEVPPKWHP